MGSQTVAATIENTKSSTGQAGPDKVRELYMEARGAQYALRSNVYACGESDFGIAFIAPVTEKHRRA